MVRHGRRAGRRCFQPVQSPGASRAALLGSAWILANGDSRVRLIYPADATPTPGAHTAAGRPLETTVPCRPVPGSLKRQRTVFPFNRHRRQEIDEARLLSNVSSRIRGVMIKWATGHGLKSTTIRACADLLPEIDVVAGDPLQNS